jgi:hypothetical protein
MSPAANPMMIRRPTIAMTLVPIVDFERRRKELSIRLESLCAMNVERGL